MDSFFQKVKGAFEDAKEGVQHAQENIQTRIDNSQEAPPSQTTEAVPQPAPQDPSQTVHNPYHSFAPQRHQNHAKYYVDGCSYFWAMSVALEQAQKEIWIMDWWLSPELYLRRPPSANEPYRLDNMLKAAAERGVRVNLMIYKEVSKVLTLNSEYTKHHLEALHPNIAVFRHPDHNPSPRALSSQILTEIQNLSFKAPDLAKLSGEGLEAIYGLADDVILFWAHHEKLCLVDGKIAFMGGLDACFGRWDTNQHEIADAHPNDIREVVFPGQDYNNARIYDFEDVGNWDRNKLDRTKDSRMGWSDLSISLTGSIVDDLQAHFVKRWNWLFAQKYASVDGDRYKVIALDMPAESLGVYYNADGSNVNLVATTEDDAKDDAAAAAANPPVEDNGVAHHVFRPGGIVDALGSRFRRRNFEADGAFEEQQPDGVSIQLLRSCTDWSHGVSTERSIANAYISTIRDSEHFVYIENQFFITATGEGNHPVKNLIGAAIVERIIRAHNDGQKYKIIVCMPSVPAFAGDLHAESSAGTLAIMNFQYRSISRGGHSIIEELQTAGIQDPLQYISFFNLRNYDRINTSAAMANTEQASGVSYEDARREHDDQVGAGYDGQGEESAAANNQEAPAYDAYQQSAADETTSRGSSYDSVAQCYMLDGPPLSSIPWTNGSQEEIDAFVSEELYIHTKCLIADDRIVIVGSANLNDRSQLGYHDSEIAVLIEDSTPVESSMNGAPYTAAKFAVALRRTLFRKHLGLIPMQDWRVPNQNYLPVDQGGNEYDWDSAPDQAVRDPLSDEFTSLWNGTASRNTEIFQRVFAPVPSNAVRNWEQYEEAYAKLFISPDPPGTEQPRPSKYAYGHVVRENFPGGVGEMKEVLGGVRGSLVTMPLDFLCEVQDLVKEGLNYNAVTDDIYT